MYMNVLQQSKASEIEREKNQQQKTAKRKAYK